MSFAFTGCAKMMKLMKMCVSSCSACQQQLPATGVPITRQRFDYMRQKFREYVRAQTLQNWKFWIVSWWMWICQKVIKTLHFPSQVFEQILPSIPVWTYQVYLDSSGNGGKSDHVLFLSFFFEYRWTTYSQLYAGQSGHREMYRGCKAHTTHATFPDLVYLRIFEFKFCVLAHKSTPVNKQ